MPSKLRFTLIFLICCTAIQLNAQSQLFFQVSGNDYASHTLPTMDGGLLICGSNVDSLTNDVNPLIVKLDSVGNIVWSNLITAPSSEAINYALQYDDSSYLIVGLSNANSQIDYDAMAMRVNVDGSIRWIKNYATPDFENAGYACFDADQNAYVVGSVSQQAYILKIDTAGNILHSVILGNGLTSTFASVAYDNSAQTVVAVGRSANVGAAQCEMLIVRFDTALNIQRATAVADTNWLEGDCIRILNFGNYLISGATTISGFGDFDCIAIEMDTSGQIIWNTCIGGISGEAFYSIQVESDGFTFSGYTDSFGEGGLNDNSNTILCKLDLNGDTIWNKLFTGALNDEALRHEKYKGGYIIGAYGSMYNSNSLDFLTIKTDANGDNECESVKFYPDLIQINNLTSTQYVYAIFSQSFAVSSLLFNVSPIAINSSSACFPLGLPQDQLMVHDLIVYPNPANHTIYFTQDTFNYEKVQLLAVDGKVIRESAGTQLGHSWNLSDIASGIYVIKCTSSKISRYQQLIIQHQ